MKASLHTLEFELRDMGSKVSLQNLVLAKVKKFRLRHFLR